MNHLYPSAATRIRSEGDTAYFVDPLNGNDSNSGLSAGHPWRSFVPVNARLLGPGDSVSIVSPGTFRETLMPMGAGTRDKPVEIRFAPGAYDFYPDNSIKLKLHISNTNDDPHTPKAVAILFKDIKHVRVAGDRTDIHVHGKMIQAMLDHAEDVTLTGLAFDYRRPLVSELTVLAVSANHADVQVHPDSEYAIENDRLVWIGEGWRSTGMALNQECDPADDGRVWRRGNGPLTGVKRVEELEPCKLRMHYRSNPGFTTGRVIQFREIFRDCAAGLVNRSRNITWRGCAFHAMGGMGIVSQFSETLTFDHVAFAPRPGSGRTTSSWADMLHFSGCRGKILVKDCTMSGSHDDPINVHGTHLRVVGRPAPNQILVRFMHPQTYGIEAFQAGDEIEFVSHTSLCAYASNTVTAAKTQNDREILVTLAAPAPASIQAADVVENVTWTPSVEVRNCRISVDSCRGLLLTTRRPVLVENNTFIKTSMSAILIADDANSWFESGPVRDVTIRGNRFIKCAEPVISIAPENRTADPDKPVHSNISIVDNVFDLVGTAAIAAKSVRGLTITGNRFSATDLPVTTTACTDVAVKDNFLRGK